MILVEVEAIVTGPLQIPVGHVAELSWRGVHGDEFSRRVRKSEQRAVFVQLLLGGQPCDGRIVYLVQPGEVANAIDSFHNPAGAFRQNRNEVRLIGILVEGRHAGEQAQRAARKDVQDDAELEMAEGHFVGSAVTKDMTNAKTQRPSVVTAISSIAQATLEKFVIPFFVTQRLAEGVIAARPEHCASNSTSAG
ncbi:MAG: hypothetical protein DMG16_09815 [Acidobacteria bacterium]|nr:MAG: hypothetical protein DMG16_09815 [Acidobacteriota bacterium]